MRRSLIIVIAFGVVLPLPAQAQDHIGAQRCQSCHEFEYRVWSMGPHARAPRSLSPAELKDAKCNSCHTMLPEGDEARFAGVQCERCHGPGRYYHRLYVMKDRELARLVGLVDPKPEQCAQCHSTSTPSVDPFDFQVMWQRIDHGKEARARYQKGRPAKPTPPPEPGGER